MKTFVLVLLCIACSSALSSDSRPRSPSELMEKSTQHAQNILKHLAKGDLVQVKSESEALRRITEEAGFTGRDERESEYGRDFIKTVAELKKAAESNNLAESCDQFNRMTSVCFSCHEHIRAR